MSIIRELLLQLHIGTMLCIGIPLLGMLVAMYLLERESMSDSMKGNKNH